MRPFVPSAAWLLPGHSLAALGMAVLGAALASCAPGAPSAGGVSTCGAAVRAHFDEPGYKARDYLTYASCSATAHPALIVYLHGCLQSADEAAVQTRWNTLADLHGLVVVYPEQFNPNSEPSGAQQVQDHLSDGNGAACWNWFRAEDVQRGSGEVATLAAITQRVIAQRGVDPSRVYVMGISAGGAMAGALAATYPDLVAAAALLAGEAYPAGTDATGLLAWQAMGAYARPMPVMIVQGSLDELVPVPSGEMNLSQWLGTNDFADNGTPDNSVSRVPASHEDHGLDTGVLDGVGTVGDLCVPAQRNSPCPGGALGLSAYPYSIDHYVDANGAPLVDYWLIHGLMHSYGGGDPNAPFSDPLGPDLTPAAYDFFMAHPRSSRQ